MKKYILILFTLVSIASAQDTCRIYGNAKTLNGYTPARGVRIYLTAAYRSGSTFTIPQGGVYSVTDTAGYWSMVVPRSVGTDTCWITMYSVPPTSTFPAARNLVSPWTSGMASVQTLASVSSFASVAVAVPSTTFINGNTRASVPKLVFSGAGVSSFTQAGDSATVTISGGTGVYDSTANFGNAHVWTQGQKYTGQVSVEGPDGISVSGTLSSGAYIKSGAGVRMQWTPYSAAFRSGQVTGTQWDNGSVGQHSAAFGLNTIASGAYSFAAGNTDTAAGTGSLAIGGSSSATGNYAIALGDHNTAQAGGTALGYNTHANNYQTTTTGHSTIAAGMYSSAHGKNTKALDTALTAVGQYNASTGTEARFVVGVGSGEGDRRNGFEVRKNGDVYIPSIVSAEVLGTDGSGHVTGGLLPQSVLGVSSPGAGQSLIDVYGRDVALRDISATAPLIADTTSVNHAVNVALDLTGANTNDVLTYNGSAAVWATPTGGGVSLAQVSATIDSGAVRDAQMRKAIADSAAKGPYGLNTAGTLGQVWKTLSGGRQGWAADSAGSGISTATLTDSINKFSRAVMSASATASFGTDAVSAFSFGATGGHAGGPGIAWNATTNAYLKSKAFYFMGANSYGTAWDAIMSQAGYWCLGATNPEMRLDVRGVMRATDTVRSGNYTTYSYFIPGGSLVTSSTKKNKTNVSDYQGAGLLEKISAINPKRYQLKAEAFRAYIAATDTSDDATKAKRQSEDDARATRLASVVHIGFLAEDMALITGDAEKISQGDINAALWKAVQLLIEENKTLKSRIDALEKKK